MEKKSTRFYTQVLSYTRITYVVSIGFTREYMIEARGDVEKLVKVREFSNNLHVCLPWLLLILYSITPQSVSDLEQNKIHLNVLKING